MSSPKQLILGEKHKDIYIEEEEFKMSSWNCSHSILRTHRVCIRGGGWKVGRHTVSRSSCLPSFSRSMPTQARLASSKRRRPKFVVPPELQPTVAHRTMWGKTLTRTWTWFTERYKSGYHQFGIPAGIFLAWAIYSLASDEVIGPVDTPKDEAKRRFKIRNAVEQDFQNPAYLEAVKNQIRHQLDAGLTPSYETVDLEVIDLATTEREYYQEVALSQSVDGSRGR